MKLSALPIILIGLAVGVVVLSYAYFHHYAPNMTQKAYDDEVRALYEAEAAKMPAAKRRVEQANQMVSDTEDAWSSIVATSTLPNDLYAGGINVNQDTWHLVIDARKFRNNVQRALNKQLKRGGVEVINGPSVPMPTYDPGAILSSYFNYPSVVPFPVVIFNLGTVTVRGSYSEISAHIRSWSNMPNYLAVTDGLQLQGTEQLTATYNLTLVGYIAAETVYPPVPEQGGGNAGGQAPGAGGPGGSGAPGRGGLGAGVGGPPPGVVPGGPPPGAFPGGRGGGPVRPSAGPMGGR